MGLRHNVCSIEYKFKEDRWWCLYRYPKYHKIVFMIIYTGDSPDNSSFITFYASCSCKENRKDERIKFTQVLRLLLCKLQECLCTVTHQWGLFLSYLDLWSLKSLKSQGKIVNNFFEIIRIHVRKCN